MKTKGYFFIGLLVLLSMGTNSYSKSWRVNNRPNISTNFTTIQGAIDSSYVHNGDTIYIEASPYTYGGWSCNKKLVIIGTGYFLFENPQTQAVPATATITGNCYIISGTFSSGSEGSKIMGVVIGNSCTSYNTMRISTSNICVQRCYIVGDIIFNGTVDNTLIMQNYITGTIGSYYTSGSDIIITNNIINSGITMDANYSGTIQNNVLLYTYLNVNYFTIQNNIMIGGTFISNSNCNYAYNMSTDTQFGTDNNNKSNVAPDTIFVCWYNCSGYSSDGRYQLSATSPAKGAGFGGKDMGIFEGTVPYVLSGMPNVPAIYEFNIGNNNDTIQMSIKAKSHQ